MGIRNARSSDKNLVLDFCTDTFEWGDYIDRTWDEWISDQSGLLLIFETTSFHSKLRPQPIAMIHIIKCPRNILWLEGLRVNKNYRKKGIATKLLNYCINYGIRKGINEFGALVSQDNFASQKMLEKMGFIQLFDCVYYNIRLEKLVLNNEPLNRYTTKFSTSLDIKVPKLIDIPEIQTYLSKNDSCKSFHKYFDSWRFCDLDSGFFNLLSLVQNNELLLIVNQNKEIVEVIILKYMTKKLEKLHNEVIIQISYLNCFELSIFFKLTCLLFKKYFNNDSYTNVYFFLPVSANLEKILNSESIISHENFYLYAKNI
ncbi:MAG: GNAT family N-acetyltransferase [Candidatus Nitrosocosmicus sp.]